MGKTIKKHRISCKMIQEFVAEHLGVSRQAVSKWENGKSEPSISNGGCPRKRRKGKHKRISQDFFVYDSPKNNGNLKSPKSN